MIDLMRWVAPVDQMTAHDPVFRYETRHLRDRATPHGLRLYMVRWLVIVGAVLGALWVLNLLPTSNWYVVSTSMSHAGWIFFASIAANLLLDLVCIIVGLNTVNRDIIDGRWDLLRLTPLSAEQIFAAKHAVVQIRAWRMTSVIFAMRFTSVLIVLITFFFIADSRGKTGFALVLDGLHNDVATLITLFGTLPLFAFFYLIEPFWRMRAMTAVSVWVSRHTNVVAALTEGFGWIVGLAISQAMIMAAILYALFRFIDFLSRSVRYVVTVSALLQLVIAIACFGTGQVIYRYYRAVVRTSINRAAKRVNNE